MKTPFTVPSTLPAHDVDVPLLADREQGGVELDVVQIEVAGPLEGRWQVVARCRQAADELAVEVEAEGFGGRGRLVGSVGDRRFCSAVRSGSAVCRCGRRSFGGFRRRS